MSRLKLHVLSCFSWWSFISLLRMLSVCPTLACFRNQSENEHCFYRIWASLFWLSPFQCSPTIWYFPIDFPHRNTLNFLLEFLLPSVLTKTAEPQKQITHYVLFTYSIFNSFPESTCFDHFPEPSGS